MIPTTRGRGAVLFLLFVQCAMAQEIPFYAGDPKILFVGNSYTGQNSLPSVFDSVIENGIPEWAALVDTRSVNPGGRTLGVHLESLEAGTDPSGIALADYLRDGPEPWKWVLLQDQSQVPGFHEYNEEGSVFRQSLDAAVRLDEYIETSGGQTMFYMTWGRRDGDGSNPEVFPDFITMQEMLEEGYRQYQQATTTSSRPTYIAPVGLVFQTIYYDDLAAGVDPQGENVDAQGRESLFRSLYEGDGSHPSIRGTYVAALTIYSSMTGMTPLEIDWFPTGVDEALGRRLQDAVSRTLLETFGSGEIDYPWTQAFPAGATTPTTQVPTVFVGPISMAPTVFVGPISMAPTTEAPSTSPTQIPAPVVQAPAPQPTTTVAPPGSTSSGNGKGAITVTLTYDGHPDDISWTFMQDGTATPIYFQPYSSGIAPNTTVANTFNDLEIGGTYIFRAIDSARDGLCCDYGYGKLDVYDEVAYETVFSTIHDFKGYFELFFEIMPDGFARRTHRSTHYRPGTWVEMEAMIRPIKEGGWPGAMPMDNSSSLVINIDVDDHPSDISWELYHQTPETRQWELVRDWAGSYATPGSLASTEFSNLELGWYHLIVKDANQNGLCCDWGRGYVSITGPLESAKGAMGLVWGNNGQFNEQDEIFFYMRGSVSHVSWSQV